ncbi:unnamed protein product [Alternaria alternata]
MSKTITNVALTGATGNVGSPILTSLLEAGFNITVIARKGGRAFPSGVSVKVVNTDSIAEITEALRGQHAIVDATSGPDPTLPGRIVEAAASARVHRIILSEFSVDPEDPCYIEWGFLRLNIRTGFINVDIRSKKVEYINDGMLPFPWTMLSSVGAAVANALQKAKETENRCLYISSVIKSQKQMVELAKEVLGRDGWEETEQDMNQKLEDATESMMAGKVDLGVIGDMIRWSAGTVPALRWKQLDDNKLLGVEQLDDDEVRKLIRDIALESK